MKKYPEIAEFGVEKKEDPKAEENWRDADYWEGVLDALKWVRDKKGEETIIYGHNCEPVKKTK